MLNFRDVSDSLWDRLKAVIKRDKGSLESVAKGIGISITALRTFMTGARLPQTKTIARIEEYLQLKER